MHFLLFIITLRPVRRCDVSYYNNLGLLFGKSETAKTKEKKTGGRIRSRIVSLGNNNSIWNFGNDATQIVRKTDVALGIDELLLTSVFSKLPHPQAQRRVIGREKMLQKNG